MFIKFSDKTKKIIVKKSKEDTEEEELDTVYLDENDEKNYRLKILKESLKENNK